METVIRFSLVGVGGLLGSIARFGIVVALSRYPVSFPFGTLVVNVVGCFVIALVSAFAEKNDLISPEIRLFMTAGFCGGFTTFSALIFEMSIFVRNQEFFASIIYLMASVVLGYSAFYAGTLLVGKLS